MEIINERIVKLARELGQEIKKDPRTEAYFAAETAYLSNGDLNRYLAEYNADQQLVRQEHEKGDQADRDFLQVLEKRIAELYEKITGHEDYDSLVRAKEDYLEMMNAVNEEIQTAVTGKRPCTHDCSTCGGCH
ncbi:MAG: YlbF family regulator [Clostridia bacterium]|nr:YlbF family regulator [Clostridia bacterium]